jgi:aldose 1-epimerase
MFIKQSKPGEVAMSPIAQSNFTFLPLGAIIQSFRVGDVDIVQSFPTADLYKQYNEPYFGETIGRVANRISGAKINNLNNKSYPLAANNGPNSLHGGQVGWGKKVFKGPTHAKRNGRDSIQFQYLSVDGEEGYPGSVLLSVWYTPSTEQNGTSSVVVLEVEYEASLVNDDEDTGETAVAITNHRFVIFLFLEAFAKLGYSYFNLSNSSSIEGTEVTLSTAWHQVVDDTNIPTGEIALYPGINSQETFILGSEEPDLDHCFIMNKDPSTVPTDTRSLSLQRLAKLYHPESRVHLEVHSTEPSFQFYTGKYIDVPEVSDNVPARGPRSGLAIEPSRYINAVNHDDWKSMVVLRRGQKFGSRIIYRAWQD